MQQPEILIIGAGPGGYETAAAAAGMGKKVTLVERSLLGGTCLNRGCIPTKCLCAAARRLVEVKGAGEFGISVGDVTADYGAAVRRASGVVAELREGVRELLGGVELIEGEARLLADGVVAVGDSLFKPETTIIATGSRPAPLRGVEGAEYAIDSDAFLRLEALPERLAIIGGGVIGLEFASIAAAYGTQVTVLEFCPEILPGFDADVAKRLRSLLERRGIKIITGAAVKSIAPGCLVSYERRGKSLTIEADMVLAAVGRRPVLPEGLADAGVELTDRGFIATDEQMRTSAAGIYAIGDVNGRCMLAHAASAQGRRVLGIDVDLDVVPSVVFTIPECAMVRRRSAPDDVVVTKTPFGAAGKALADGATDGFVKLESRPDDDILTACSIVGEHAAELIMTAATAIEASMTRSAFAHRLIHAHPGLTELFI